jgi:hypothetical protein
MTKQGTFAAAATAHDDEHVAVINHKIQVVHQHKRAERHSQVTHSDMWGTRDI